MEQKWFQKAALRNTVSLSVFYSHQVTAFPSLSFLLLILYKLENVKRWSLKEEEWSVEHQALELQTLLEIAFVWLSRSFSLKRKQQYLFH